jgi:calcium permeable stress-gated cation channel
MNFIALRSIRRDSNASTNIAGETVESSLTGARIQRRQSTVDEEREKFSKFINPSLTVP